MKPKKCTKLKWGAKKTTPFSKDGHVPHLRASNICCLQKVWDFGLLSQVIWQIFTVRKKIGWIVCIPPMCNEKNSSPCNLPNQSLPRNSDKHVSFGISSSPYLAFSLSNSCRLWPSCGDGIGCGRKTSPTFFSQRIGPHNRVVLGLILVLSLGFQYLYHLLYHSQLFQFHEVIKSDPQILAGDVSTENLDAGHQVRNRTTNP